MTCGEELADGFDLRGDVERGGVAATGEIDALRARAAPRHGLGHFRQQQIRLGPAQQQNLSLFEESPVKPALNSAIDRVNLRFGKGALYFGHSHGAQDHAPMRVAFTRIPDLDTER